MCEKEIDERSSPIYQKHYAYFLGPFFGKKGTRVKLNLNNPHYMGRMRCSECACRYDAKHDPANWCGYCGDYTQAVLSWW